MDALRVLVAALSLLAIFGWLHWALRCRSIWLYAVVPLTWLVNEAAFWVLRWMAPETLGPSSWNMWSMVLHLQGLVLAIAIPVIFWRCPMTVQRDNRQAGNDEHN